MDILKILNSLDNRVWDDLGWAGMRWPENTFSEVLVCIDSFDDTLNDLCE